MRLLHVGLIIADMVKAAAFYEGILGLKPDTRPHLGFEGLFYDLGEGQQLHLMCIANPYEGYSQPEHGGRDRHVALAVKDLSAIRQRLDKHKITYTMSKSGRAALFCHDADGNAIELCEV